MDENFKGFLPQLIHSMFNFMFLTLSFSLKNADLPEKTKKQQQRFQFSFHKIEIS